MGCVCVYVGFLLFLKSISNIYLSNIFIQLKYLSNKCHKNLCIKKNEAKA